MEKYNRSLSRVFTRKVFDDFISKGYSDVFSYVVEHYIDDPTGKTNGQLISDLYQLLDKSYRNEYFYINTLLNKLLVGIHNVNTTTALTQIRVAEHVADFVMINGEARVYEIKSELDNLERLNAQIDDYYKAFAKVSVLAPETKLAQVTKELEQLGDIGKYVGIYVLTDNNVIFNKKMGREPIECTAKLNHYAMFAILRKQEYLNIISDYYGYTPNEPAAFLFRVCLNLYEAIPVEEAYRLFLKQLKKRNSISKESFNTVPPELRSIVYFANYSKKVPELMHFLQKSYI